MGLWTGRGPTAGAGDPAAADGTSESAMARPLLPFRGIRGPRRSGSGPPAAATGGAGALAGPRLPEGRPLARPITVRPAVPGVTPGGPDRVLRRWWPSRAR